MPTPLFSLVQKKYGKKCHIIRRHENVEMEPPVLSLQNDVLIWVDIDMQEYNVAHYSLNIEHLNLF